MTITQLRYFIIAAKMENLSGAAASLYVTQSTLSKNIASLENELGIRLFDRRGKSLHLNAAGEQFLASCQKMLGELDDVVGQIRRTGEGQELRIRIGAEGEIGPLLSWMSDIHQLHPEVSFEVDSSLGDVEHPDINEYDVMIYPEGLKYAKYKGYPVYTETFYLAVPAQDSRFGKEPVSNRELNGSELVFVRLGSGKNEYPYEVCRCLMIETAAEHFVNNEVLKRTMIAEGIASGFVSSENVDLYRHDRRILLYSLVSSRFSRQMMICFRRKKHLSGIAQEFCSYIRSCCSLEEE